MPCDIMKKIVALNVRWFETTRSSRSQLVSTSYRNPSSGVMKNWPKRVDFYSQKVWYIDQWSIEWTVKDNFHSHESCSDQRSVATGSVKKLFNWFVTCEHILTPMMKIWVRCGRPDQFGQRCEVPLYKICDRLGENTDGDSWWRLPVGSWN